MNSKSYVRSVDDIIPIRIKSEIAEHLDLFHKCALEELVARGRAEIVS